jgi:hypothetical protein
VKVHRNMANVKINTSRARREAFAGSERHEPSAQ